MNLDDALIVSLTAVSAAAVANIIGASLYDLKQVRLRHRRALKPNSKQFRRRPLVTVIIPAHDNEKIIRDSLQSLVGSSYRKVEVIVADNGSSDGTKRVVREFSKTHPKKAIMLYAKRRQIDDKQLVSEAFRRYGHGELVVCLKAGSVLGKNSLAKAAQHFNDNERVDAARLNQQAAHGLYISGLFQEFGLLFWSRSMKAASAFNRRGFESGQDNPYAILYSADAFRGLGHKRSKSIYKAVYASDSIVYVPCLTLSRLIGQTYSRKLNSLRSNFKITASAQVTKDDAGQILRLGASFLRALAWLVVPAILTYFTYLAVHLHEPTFILASWAAMALFAAFAIWEDEQLGLRQKLRYTLLMPINYGWFYIILSLINYVVLLTSFLALRTKPFKTP
ncbi:MAG TPA: glycosyltransferase family 2 protein [Candidatus Saccharimonadia bacterium]|nr:glycosyltransferase family 2 protein [Candidatus Saccharimonadia bacterium]